jgi:hypothetical protein
MQSRYETKDGKPLHALPRPCDIARFLKYVVLDPVNGCWIWQSHVDKRKGYAQFWFRGRAYWAHRWAFQVFRGVLAHGEQGNHIEQCRNPRCVCPYHINGLTVSENSIDGNRYRWDVVEPAKRKNGKRKSVNVNNDDLRF